MTGRTQLFGSKILASENATPRPFSEGFKRPDKFGGLSDLEPTPQIQERHRKLVQVCHAAAQPRPATLGF